MTVLSPQVICISYKKLVHDLDLQVFMIDGLAKVHIWMNERFQCIIFSWCPTVSETQ